jgi:DNA polymerase-1
MSCDCGDLPSSFDRFRSVWHVDFEFRPDANHKSVPVSMFAKEHRTGAEISMRRDQLLTCTRAPFDTGSDSLMVAYAAVAELTCFRVLRWPLPHNTLCTYTEASAAINGLNIVGLGAKRPSLLETCDLYGIPHVTAEYKNQMRALILEHDTYTPEQWLEIDQYNRSDVDEDLQLLEKLAPGLNLPAALFRGRYLAAVTDIELRGLPVDVDCIRELVEQWQALRLYYIRRDDTFHLYDETGSFVEDRFTALVKDRGWIWSRTPTGRRPELNARAFGKAAQRYPELRPLQRLRDQIAELRLGAFINTVGADGTSRCPVMPFWARSGRNQPQGRGLVFLLSLPSWTHGVIKPPPGWGCALLDWTAQEPAIAAGLSGDPVLIEDYRSGDPHMRFAIRAGLAPEGATKKTHEHIREMIKPVSHGANYGITKYGVAAKTGKSLTWASEMLARHRYVYRTFSQWQQNVVTQAQFDECIVSPLGWPMAVTAETKTRTLLNFPMQSGGGDCMRLAAIAAYEAGIQICAVAHDAFWVMAPVGELDDAITTMSQLMVRAGNVITGGLDIPVEVSARVHWPHCLGDVRSADKKGQAMWIEIRDLVRGGGLQQAAG